MTKFEIQTFFVSQESQQNLKNIKEKFENVESEKSRIKKFEHPEREQNTVRFGRGIPRSVRTKKYVLSSLDVCVRKMNLVAS